MGWKLFCCESFPSFSCCSLVMEIVVFLMAEIISPSDVLPSELFHWHWATPLYSLWPSDPIWWHRSESTLAQVMAWCHQAPSNYLNQCWHLISEVLWHLPERKFTVIAQAIILYNKHENYIIKITAASPRGQWINHCTAATQWQWSNNATGHMTQ